MGPHWFNSSIEYKFLFNHDVIIVPLKKRQVVCISLLIAILNNGSSLSTFAFTEPTCAGHFRIVPVPVLCVETQNIASEIYPMHN